MKKHIGPAARLIGFLACLVLMAWFANTHLLKMDTVPYVNIREMQAREDIEMAIIGSSIVRDHFNPELITARTGLTAFDAAIPCASLPTHIAMTEELFRTNRPEWTVLVMEPYNFNTTKEQLEAQYKLGPMLSSPLSALRYYLRLCREDGKYIDRLLLFRTDMANSLADLQKNFGLKYNTRETYESLAASFGEGITYQGAGFLRYDVPANHETLARQRMVRRQATRWEYSLMPATQEGLLAYKELCAQQGTNLLVILFPMHTAPALGNPDFLPYYDSVMDFCEENGIACYNFAYAKPEFMPRLDEYYFDLDHMNGEGADILSAAFSAFFSRLTAGEDVSGLFYRSRFEYLNTVDFITNCWVQEEGEGRFRADGNYGYPVTPEYRFMLLDPDGSLTLLRDYAQDPLIEADIPEGCNLRVYARPVGGEQDDQVYFDYPTDYEAFVGEHETYFGF